MGPKTEPWGTPLSTDAQCEKVPRTLCFLSFNHSMIQLRSLPVIPWLRSFAASLLWGTLSKAFAKSKKTTSTL